MRVLVVGAGIGGLATAACFGQRGADVDVVEIRTTQSTLGVGLDTTANGARVLREIGVLDRCLDAGFAFDTIDFCDAAGHVAVTQRSGLSIEGLPANLGIRRDALHSALVAAATAHGAALRRGVTVATLSNSVSGSRVEFSDGTAQRYDLVVGADGIRSDLRHRTFGERYAPSFTGYVVWRATVRRPPEVTGHVMYQGAGIKAGLCPISGEEMYLIVVKPGPLTPSIDRAMYRDELIADLAGFGGYFPQIARGLPNSSRVALSPIEEVRLPGPWFHGRTVVIGDAAHACAPHLAQGSSMAMEDGSVLAEVCAGSDDIETGLALFQERRTERVRLVQDVSRQILVSEMTSAPTDHLRSLARTLPAQSKELGSLLSAMP
jgi:2-polyprenyl-6-methoxyphenol hydroxylase-like FAD-dependent oxidoreductase